MLRWRSLVVISFAVTGLVFLAAASESLATQDWHVNGTLLSVNSSAEIPFQLPKIDSKLAYHFTNAGTPILILCNSIHISGRIFGGNRLFYKVLLLECHTFSPTPTNCTLGTNGLATIESRGGILGEAKSSTRGSVKPETGKTFTEVPFTEGTTCPLEGIIPVKGEFIVGTPTGSSEVEEQGDIGLGSEENNSLEIGTGNKLIVLGKILIKIKAASTWSFN